MPVPLTDNFDDDWTTILRDELATAGYPPAGGETQRQLCLRYFNLKRRTVEARPRELFIAQELAVPPAHQAGYEGVVAKLKNGDDLTPHLSTRLTDINFNDGLLNDWEFYHFHLGTAVQPNGFVNRTGPLLFARIEPNRAYLIGVMTHNDFNAQILVDILSKNWPDMMAKYEAKNAMEAESHLTDAEVGQLRRAGITPIIKAPNGKFYHSMGGGLTLGRGSIWAARQCNYRVKSIREIRKSLNGRAEKIAEALAAKGHNLANGLRFRLRRGVGQQISVIEENSGVEVESYDAL